jgi:hypothetical protein
MRHHRMSRAQKITGMIVGFLILAPLITLVMGTVVKFLWNWLMPTLFHLPAITFWQTIGLLFLSWILFGGRRGFTPVTSRWERRRWRQRLDMWQELTPEQRAELRGRWGRCVGGEGEPGDDPTPSV